MSLDSRKKEKNFLFSYFLFPKAIKVVRHEYKIVGAIDLIGTICIGKGWAYDPIPNLRIREYPMTTNKGKDENYALKRDKQYLCRI